MHTLGLNCAETIKIDQDNLLRNVRH